MPFFTTRPRSQCRPKTPAAACTTSSEKGCECTCCPSAQVEVCCVPPIAKKVRPKVEGKEPKKISPKIVCPPADVVVCQIKKCCCKKKKPNPKCKIENCCCRKPKEDEHETAEKKACERPRSKCRSLSKNCDRLWCQDIGKTNKSCERSNKCDKSAANSTCCRAGCSKPKPCMQCCKVGCCDRPPMCIVCRCVRCVCNKA